MKSVLSIAGSDSSGGAGIQADLKTIEAHHLFGQTAITALTAQNTTGVFGVFDVAPAFIAQQIDVVFDDIQPDAVKIGMVSRAESVHAIVEALVRNEARNIVVDPVMVATSGARLIDEEALAVLRDELIPLADVITPNMPEAEVLTGMAIRNPTEQVKAALLLTGAVTEASVESAGRRAKAALVKGGHGNNDANDVLARNDGTTVWFNQERIDTSNTHGTGCTLSSAIACGLAQGLSVEDAVGHAKSYITGALSAGLDLGKGSGPMDHMWNNRLV